MGKRILAVCLAVVLSSVLSSCGKEQMAEPSANRSQLMTASVRSEIVASAVPVGGALLENMFAAVEQEYTARSMRQLEKGAEVQSKEKLLRVEIVAGDDQEFVGDAVVYGEYRSSTEAERNTNRLRFRFSRTQNHYQAESMSASQDPVKDLQPVFYVKEYNDLPFSLRWNFSRQSDELILSDLKSLTETKVPLPISSQSKTAYTVGTGILAAVSADRVNGAQIVTSPDGVNFASSQIEAVKGHVVEEVLISFYDNQLGVVAVNADREMGYYNSLVFLTQNGGRTWAPVPTVSGVTQAVYGVAVSPAGGVFLSYQEEGSDDPPVLYRSEDQGKHWKSIFFTTPDSAKGTYHTVCAPAFSGDQGTLRLTGGEGVRARYSSADGGVSWNYQDEIAYAQDFSW